MINSPCMYETRTLIKILGAYTIPNVISMWVFTLYTMVDGIFVSRCIGAAALAGVNIALPFINGMFSIAIMIGVGSSTLIAIAFAEHKYQEGNRLFTLAAIMNVTAALCTSALIYMHIDSIIRLLGIHPTEPAYPFTKDYLTTIVLFSVFYMAGYAFEIYIKVDGNPLYPLFCVIAGAITNIALDYRYIVIYSYGVRGAAFATGIAQIVTCSLLLCYLLFKARLIHFVKVPVAYIKYSISIVKTGIAEFITEISSGLLLFIYNYVILNIIGISGVSQFGVVSYITSFITMTMIGFGQGIQPVMSFLFGAKDFKSLQKMRSFSLIFIAALGILAYALVNCFASTIGVLFFAHTNNSSEVTTALHIYSLAYSIMGINIFIAAYFTAVKKIQYSVGITLIRGLVCNALFLLIMPRFIGETGIWVSAFLSELGALCLSLYLLKRAKRAR
ncbi:MAG: MATE family efflux transporter [Treponema sp.]